MTVWCSNSIVTCYNAISIHYRLLTYVRNDPKSFTLFLYSTLSADKFTFLLIYPYLARLFLSENKAQNLAYCPGSDNLAVKTRASGFFHITFREIYSFKSGKPELLHPLLNL